jgi:hypothetical protein
MSSLDWEWVNRVSLFMQEVGYKYQDREDRAMEELGDQIPYGDLAYGKAVADWNHKGKPNSWFFYEEGSIPCPYLMEFRKEISEEFGLPILTKEEAEERRKLYINVIDTRVPNWKNLN